MKLTITSRDTAIGMRTTERIEKKAAKMGRYLLQNTEMQVKLRKEKDELRICEITVPMGDGVILRAEASAKDNLYLAIDQALDRIERQIHRHRTRLGKRIREDAFKDTTPEYFDEEIPEEEDKPTVVRHKTFPVRPMSVEDAAVEMEMLGHSFFAFVNIETERTNILYQRKDGTLGLLEPEA